MDANELIRRAWEAVEKAGVPEPLQEIAFKEAIDFLRGDSGELPAEGDSRSTQQRQTSRRQTRKSTNGGRTNSSGSETSVDEGTFFADLATESDANEQDLRDVLRLVEGRVEVIPPGRTLGATKADQAKAVTALVAGARARGLNEDPVNAEAVRDEVKRKHAFDSGNYAKQLGKMKGFNAGSDRTEIVLRTPWVGEFNAALALANGKTLDDAE